MQQNSFLLGYNYSNRDITRDARTGWRICPVQDIKYGVDVNVNVNVGDTFSALYCDLYLRQWREALKHTMLVQESLFDTQIHELHRLYWKQKELMMEMEKARHQEALYLNSGFSIPRSHWMYSSISAYQTRSLPHEEDIKAGVLEVKKSEKKVLDLELPVSECSDMNGDAHEALNSLKEQPLESRKQLNKLQLDLNEPATSNEKNEGEDSVKGSHRMNEAQESVKCGGEYGIDLNMSPTSSEDEETIFKKSETEKPQESSSVSLHGKHRSEQSRVIVQALPCSTSILLLNRRYKRGSRKRKKVKLGSSKGLDLDTRSSVQATSESHTNQLSMEKGRSSSVSKVKSTMNQANLGKKRRYKPQVKSSDGHKSVAKKKRKKSRRICLVTEGNYQEISAAEAIVDISRSSGQETANCITSLSRTLLWFAKISSSVVVDKETDCLEAMSLELTEMNLEEHKTILSLNSADNETEVSSIVFGKQRRSRTRQRKRKYKDNQHDDYPSLGAFSECEANEDLQVIEKLIEASESKSGLQTNWGATKKRRRCSRIPATDFQHLIINQVIV